MNCNPSAADFFEGFCRPVLSEYAKVFLIFH